MVLDASDLGDIDKYHRNLMRMIQTLPESTAKPAIYLLTGTLPAQADIHKKMMNLFMAILHRPGTPEYHVVRRQLALKTLESNSWTVQIRKLLHKYRLPPALVLAATPPKPEVWKSRVREAVQDYWEMKLKEDAAPMKSLINLNLNVCGYGYTHPVWLTGTNPVQAVMATVRAAMLVGRYTFTGHKVSGTRQTTSCPYCDDAEPETISHFILRCPLYTDIRATTEKRLNQETNNRFQEMSSENKVKIIIDPSIIAVSEEEAIRLESAARQEIFAMHNRRAVKDERGSMYKWAVARAREGSGVLGCISSKSKLSKSLVPTGARNPGSPDNRRDLQKK